jgi:hypothetical protein
VHIKLEIQHLRADDVGDTIENPVAVEDVVAL